MVTLILSELTALAGLDVKSAYRTVSLPFSPELLKVLNRISGYSHEHVLDSVSALEVKTTCTHSHHAWRMVSHCSVDNRGSSSYPEK